MPYSYKSETYVSYRFVEHITDEDESALVRFVIYHHDNSCPNSPVTIAPIEIDGEEIKTSDPRYKEITLPFGLLAEFVGLRVLQDKMSEVTSQIGSPRHALGLRDQD